MSFYVPGFDSDAQMIITQCRWTFETQDGSLSDRLDLRPPSGKPIELHKVSQSIIAGWVAEQVPYTEKELTEQIEYNKKCKEEKEARKSYTAGPYVPTAGDFFFVAEGTAQKAEEAKEAVKTKVKEKAKKVAKKVKEVIEENKS